MRKDYQILKRLQNYCHTSSGNATVEFALILPIFCLLGLATLDFGTIVYNKINLRTAVNAGVDAIMGVTTLSSEVQTLVNNSNSIPGITVTVSTFCQCSDNTANSCSTTCTGGEWPDRYYQITANTSADLVGYYGGLANPFPLTETATIMVP